jgi:putative nucleotidyltransferase with HDIG domain
MKSSLISTISSLPSDSAVLQRIGIVVANPESSAQDIVGVVRLDPAISGKILRLANSAYFGVPRRVSSLQNAVVLLGQKRIHSLVLSSVLVSKFRCDPAVPLRLERFWRHSIAVAHIAESIAKFMNRHEPVDIDEAFCAGLLHDVGKLVLCGFDGPLVASVLRTSAQRGIAFFMAEDEENSHVKVGELLGRHWNFPAILLSAIACHHTPAQCPDSTRRQSSLVHIADAVAHVLGFQVFDPEIAPTLQEDTVNALSLSPEQLRVIANRAVEDQKKIESLMNFFS